MVGLNSIQLPDKFNVARAFPLRVTELGLGITWIAIVAPNDGVLILAWASGQRRGLVRSLEGQN